MFLSFRYTENHGANFIQIYAFENSLPKEKIAAHRPEDNGEKQVKLRFEIIFG